MENTIQVGSSALIVHSLMEDLKKAGIVMSPTGMVIMSALLNFTVNFTISLADAVASGKTLSIPLVQALASTVLAAIYHDWRTGPSQK